jgi:hypothetical protein
MTLLSAQRPIERICYLLGAALIVAGLRHLGLFVTGCVVEVSGITLQAWRHVPSHFNTSYRLAISAWEGKQLTALGLALPRAEPPVTVVLGCDPQWPSGTIINMSRILVSWWWSPERRP